MNTELIGRLNTYSNTGLILLCLLGGRKVKELSIPVHPDCASVCRRKLFYIIEVDGIVF